MTARRFSTSICFGPFFRFGFNGPSYYFCIVFRSAGPRNPGALEFTKNKNIGKRQRAGTHRESKKAYVKNPVANEFQEFDFISSSYTFGKDFVFVRLSIIVTHFVQNAQTSSTTEKQNPFQMCRLS